MGRRLWVDDVRQPPDDSWVWAKSVYEAKVYITQMHRHNNIFNIEVISLDHDAGDYAFMGGDFIKILDWMEENEINIPIHLHTMNPVGERNMRQIIQKNGWTELSYYDIWGQGDCCG